MQSGERWQFVKIFMPVAIFLISIVIFRISIAQSNPQIQCEGVSADPTDLSLLRCPAKGVTAVLCPPEGSWSLYLEGDFFRCINEQEFALKTQKDYMQCKKTSQGPEGTLYGTTPARGCNNDDIATRCWYPYELKDGRCVSGVKCPQTEFPLVHFEKGAFRCLSHKEFRSKLQQENPMQCETPDGSEVYTALAIEGCAAGDIATLCPYQYELQGGSCVSNNTITSKTRCTKSSSPIPHFEGGVLRCLNPKEFGSILKGGSVMQCETSAGEIYTTSVAEGCNAGDTTTICPLQYELKDNRCVAMPQNTRILQEIPYVIIERTPPVFDIGQCSTYQINFEKSLKTNNVLITAAESVRRESAFTNRAFKKSFMKHISSAARAERKAKTAVQKFECTQNSYEATKEILNAFQGEVENVQNDIKLVSQSIAVQNVVIGIQKDIQFADGVLRTCIQRASKDESKKVCADFDNELGILKKNLRELIEAKDDVSESELILLEEETAEFLKRLKTINNLNTKSLQGLQKKEIREKTIKRQTKKSKSRQSPSRSAIPR